MMAYHPPSNHHWPPQNHGYMHMPPQALSHMQAPQVQPQSQPQPQQIGSPRPRFESFKLKVLQQPAMAKAANGKDKDRKPVDPPPILQLTLPPTDDPDGVYRQSPYLIVVAYLEYAPGHPHGPEATPPINAMTGTMVSSLHRLKDPTNKEGAFFIFGDLTIKSEGFYVIKFDLLQMESEGPPNAGQDCLVTVTSIKSDAFRVHAGKAFPGMAESTFLTRSFSDQGVRLRLRKDSRAIANKKRSMSTAKDMEHKQKLARQPTMTRQSGHEAPIDERGYYDPNQYGEASYTKRHRTGSSSLNPGTPTQSDGSVDVRWGSYASSAGQTYGTQGSLGTGTTGPPASSSTAPPLMPPPTSRIDTSHFSMGQPSSVFTSPTERQSPITQSPMHQSPVQFGANPQGSSPHPFIFTGGPSSIGSSSLPTASMSSHSHMGMGASNMQSVSPRSHTHINGATPTGTASPIGANMYSTAPPTTSAHQPHQPSYNNSYQSITNAFDHGTIREHGMGTPLTGNMPPDGLPTPYSDYYAKPEPNS
ncbi:velvet factor-domain-containing protein [Xylariomycetidae sp. FL2044]|nr:velvet factor-domain-containing protein [Xylariomycetidae sp. FL2044]